MRSPQTLAGQVWLNRHYEQLQQFLQSLRRDGEALAEAARSLRFLLEREPDYAREARQLALQCALGNWNAGFPAALAELVSVGLDAEVMSTDLGAEPVPGDMLLLLLADSQLLAGDRLEGLATIDRLAERPPATGPAAAWVEARASLLRAELDELDLEAVRAYGEFESARDGSRELLEEQADALRDDWIAQVFGPRDETIAQAAAALEETALLLLAQTHVSAALGLLRTAPADDERAEAAELAHAAIESYGLTKPPSPFELADALARLRPNVAHSLGGLLRDRTGGAADALLASGLASGLDPELLEAVRASVGGGADERTRTAWDIVTGVAIARGAERLGDLDAAKTAYTAALSGAVQSGLGLPQAYAAGAFAAYLLRHEPETEAADEIADIFLLAFEGTVAVEEELLDEAGYRALFDDAISLVARRQLTRLDALEDPDETQRLSILLDLLRSRAAPQTAGLARIGPERTQSAVGDALAAVTNTLERIDAAIAGSAGTVVLILQGEPRDQQFLLIDRSGVGVHAAGPEYAEVLDALDDEAAQAVFALGAGIPETGAVAAAGRRAYDALPEAVREALAQAEVLLVANDFHGETAEAPFELFHDGDGHLLTRLVIARFTSLQHLARTLDTRSEHPVRRRALVTVAPNALPDRPLYTASSESAAVSATLEQLGYDVPPIDEARLSARFFTDRLGHVGVLHVAAHGESTAGVEYVALPGGRRLSVDDLLARPQRSLPFAYLNTCRLGRTRYLGGGRARGIAYTLSELGAPAVIANTTDVLDDVSTAIAGAFYEEARALPVGPALAAARRRMVASGASPVLVARVLLYGDPWHTIGTALRRLDDPAADLLDAYFAPGAEADRAAAWLRAQDAAEARPSAAIALVRVVSELDPEAMDEDGLAALTEAIELADLLHHQPARAMLRVVLLQHVEEDPELLRDAIRHVEPLRDSDDQWHRIELDLRARLRKLELAASGLEIQHHGPAGQEGDEALDAMMSILLATQQAAEDETGKVELRPREDSLDDIAWNAVVVGHPNRFEDVAEASGYCLLLTRKLIARGHLPEAAEPFAHPMLTGLMWFLWSSQKTAYLEPELAAGQAGTVTVAVRDIAARWSPPPRTAKWAKQLAAFGDQVDEVLARLDDAPWESVHEETDEGVAALREQAEQLLAGLAAPKAAPGAAAYVTGLLATRNTFSPLEGSVPEYIHEQLTSAVWTLNGDNEGRFMPYLMDGFEQVRSAEPDELARWRMEESATASDRTESRSG